MSNPVDDDFWALTEKEKQTLRLIVSGHDAKSAARSLGLSVHTINERLRDARRKMAVSSSREAARRLLEAERDAPRSLPPDLFGDTRFGGGTNRLSEDDGIALVGSAGQADRRPWIIIGVLVMTIVLGLFALVALPQSPSAPVPVSSVNAEVVDAARQWVTLVDQGRWDESYRATGASFRKLNTLQMWTSASEKVRAQFGAVTSRAFASEETLAAPPDGYEVVKFRTSFVNKPDTIETVSLDRENGQWRVVGVTID